MNNSALCAAIAVTMLAGCNGFGTGNPTDSSFATPSSSGALSRAGGSGARSGNDFSSVTGNGYGYQVGAVSNDGLQGFAGLAPGASVTPISGTPGNATMSGSFEVAVIKYILTNGTSVSGQTTLDRGGIDLTVDFENGTVTGGGTGLDGGFANIVLDNNPLRVDGRISGETLTGTVTYDGVSGPLRGLVGEDEAIGAFHGHTDRQVHAGGFIVNPDE